MAASIWNPGSTTTQSSPATAPFSFVKGTVGNPGINFVGDTDTGIYSDGDGVINLVVNGVTQLRVSPTGDILGTNFVFSPELTIASSATVDLGSVSSNCVQITGTNTISSFGTTYEGPKFIRFASALTLTNSASLILPGGTNISISAGDSCIVTPKATAGVSDGWILISLQKGAGGSGGAGATGASGNYVFFENDQTVTGDYTLSNGKNAVSAGPITINNGITVTIPTGAVWTIV